MGNKTTTIVTVMSAKYTKHARARTKQLLYKSHKHQQKEEKISTREDKKHVPTNQFLDLKEYENATACVLEVDKTRRAAGRTLLSTWCRQARRRRTATVNKNGNEILSFHHF